MGIIQKNITPTDGKLLAGNIITRGIFSATLLTHYE